MKQIIFFMIILFLSGCASLQKDKPVTYKVCLARNWVPQENLVKEDMMRATLNSYRLYLELSNDKLIGKIGIKDNCLLVDLPS